ncbi:glycosyltransferase [Candidatus Uhrbacteria bacterium]|nr:glycosyltransferase [Candidatus Uhrbacteria bacterium]
MASPKISVVCPTWNSAAFVKETIRTVLEQSVSPFELIISDDGSSDQTLEVVRQATEQAPFPVQILQNTHAGPGAARNAGIRAARGEWIAFLDSDDLWHLEKIARVCVAIRAHHGVNFFCHNVYHFLNGKQVLKDLASRYRRDIPLPKQLFTNYFIGTSAVVCKRDILLSYNGFDETFPSAQDYEMWLRMSPLLNIVMIPEALVWYIDRPESISAKNSWRHFKNVLRAFSKNREYVNRVRYYYAIIRYTAVFCKNQLATFLRKDS